MPSPGETIPWASLYHQGTSLGVASNEKGLYEFLIPDKYLNDSLLIQALGYKSVGLAVNDLKGQAFHIIKLEERIYLLKELTVVSPDPKAIVKKAFDNWNNNFCVSDYEFDSFYRQTQKENGRFAKLWECSLRGLDHVDFQNIKMKRCGHRVSTNPARVTIIEIPEHNG